ncbi:MAG: D-glycero-beta-D-manno-heptose-7-phosphate kinase [Nitrospirae bacterium]|nr:D-glycero-beta-D-manno-heptose-7-phosphate kinase [Nitrospirota bacterium]MBF0534971.1 D-glycero-beta-D-manno-heptose-7-phosphate kinase [Nitrospirota bacterium]MBF0617177.1 D-glycero-beta-D-manno-heptose-7-phosphate kinase [Nitrospirota bacterium]
MERFKDRHILVIGDIILDHYVWGKVERISPEAPVPVVDVERESYLLGGAGNVANNVVSLGASVTISGVAGDDYNEVVLSSLFKERGISTAGIYRDQRPTTTKSRVMAHGQQVVRFDKENRAAIGKSALKHITEYVGDNFDKFDGIIISDYKKGVITQGFIKFLVDKTAGEHKFISADPKVGHFQYYHGLSLITPNKKEAQEGSGITIEDKQSLERAGKKLLKTLNLNTVLITRGDEGMSLFYETQVHHIPTVAKAVYDVTGAGDTVISAFTLAHVSGASLVESAVIANHAAGIVVGFVGTAVTTVDAVLSSLNDTHTNPDSIAR